MRQDSKIELSKRKRRMPLNRSKGLTHIRGQVSSDSLTNDCGGEGCRVYRTDIPKKRIVIDVEEEFDARGDNRKRGDRLLFYGNAGKKLADGSVYRGNDTGKDAF